MGGQTAVIAPVRKDRKIYIELMRIVSIYFVIYNHSGGFFLFPQYLPTSVEYWGSLFLSIFCKFAVPVFFAISGALMLSRPQEPLDKLWVGKILKFALLLLLGSFYAYLKDIGLGESMDAVRYHFSLTVFVKQLYSISLAGHLWFLYAYIAYLIVLPLLRSLAQNLETKYFYYFFGLAFAVKALVPIAEYVFLKNAYSMNSDFQIGWIAWDVILYPLLGYFLEYRCDWHKSGKKVVLLWVAVVFTTCIACVMTWYRGNLMGGYSSEESQYFHRSFDMVSCAAVYLGARYICDHIRFPQWCRNLIISGGKCTFGIYYFHMLWEWKGIARFIEPVIAGDMALALVSAVYILVMCWITTAVIRKIPCVGKLF